MLEYYKLQSTAYALWYSLLNLNSEGSKYYTDKFYLLLPFNFTLYLPCDHYNNSKNLQKDYET